MPKFTVKSPDGQSYAVNAPEGATEQDAVAYVQKSLYKPAPESSTFDSIKQGIGNTLAGGIRGAGSIGATLLWPIDKAQDLINNDRNQSLASLVTGGAKPLSRNEERRKAMDDSLQSLGADPESWMYKGGKLGGEIAGTAGMGGALANLGARVPMLASKAAPLLEAIKTSGMAAGGMSGLPGLGARVAGGAITGAASAGAINPEDALTGAAVGGAFPLATKAAGKAGEAIGRTLRGGGASAEVQSLANRAKALGIDIPADRLVDSKSMNAVASALNYVPLSGRYGTEKRMVSQLDQALSRTFGQDSPNVTIALRKAANELGSKFDDVLQNNTVKVDKQFIAELADASNIATKELGQDGAGIIAKQVDDIIAKAGSGQIDGQAAYNIKKTLDRIGNRNSPEAFYARELKKTLMGALDRSLGVAEAAAFATTRKQYGNMLALENLAQNGAEGGVSVARLGNMKHINNTDMQEIADIAAQFVKPREGQHGAMQRGFAAMGIGGSMGLPALAGVSAGGRVVNSMLNSNAVKNFILNQNALPGRLGGAIDELLPAMYRVNPVLAGGLLSAQ